MIGVIDGLPTNVVGLRGRALGWLMPGDARVFPVAALGEATNWVCR